LIPATAGDRGLYMAEKIGEYQMRYFLCGGDGARY
jgi:hypothetical protein